MTVKSNYVVAIATHSDLASKTCDSFSTNEKQNQNQSHHARVSCVSSKLRIIARNCDWFMALLVPVVIGGSNCFGSGLSTVIWKPLWKVEHKQLKLVLLSLRKRILPMVFHKVLSRVHSFFLFVLTISKNVLKSFNFFLFADDTNILYADYNLKSLDNCKPRASQIVWLAHGK